MKRMIAGAVTLAALAGGAAVAVAATNDEKAAEKAVLSDAAKRLDVTSEELRSALAAAEDAQLDAAVKAGELTQEQADEIKQRRAADGTVLRLRPGGAGHHRGGPGGHHGRSGRLLEDTATALGINSEQLLERLRDAETVAEIAQAEGRTLPQVKSAVKAAATKRLDAALDADRITQAQYDEMVEHLADRVERLGERPVLRGSRGPHPGTRDGDEAGGGDAVHRSA